MVSVSFLRSSRRGTGWLAGIPRPVLEPNCLAVAKMEFRGWFCLALCIAIALELPHYALKIHGSRLGLLARCEGGKKTTKIVWPAAAPACECVSLREINV